MRPQTIEQVEALAGKLTRQGVIGSGIGLGLHVQGRYCGVTFCGRVVSIGTDQKGRTAYGVKASQWPFGVVRLTGLNVKACESLRDGKCQCAGADSAQAQRAAAALALPPLGNTGVTVWNGGTA